MMAIAIISEALSKDEQLGTQIPTILIVSVFTHTLQRMGLQLAMLDFSIERQSDHAT